MEEKNGLLLDCLFCGDNVRLETTIMDTTIICKKCRLSAGYAVFLS